MSSPIFDSTFGTGRFKHEEPMTTPFTPKEDRMTITDADLDYLRNINTSPGPNAGRSIDPTKPGPDADRASPEPQGVRRALEAAEWRIISEALRIAREDGSIDNFATDAEYEALKEKVRARAANRSVHGEPIPDCPTDGVAARQGNGG